MGFLRFLRIRYGVFGRNRGHNRFAGSIVTCPHALVLGDIVACACLKTVFPGHANPNYPCDRCRSQWTDGTPPVPADRSTWTPTLLAFVGTTEPAKPPPIPCFNLGRVLVASCCTRKRIHQCTTPTASGRDRTTIPDCQKCKAYDPDD